MKKIGLITFHRPVNFGAALQSVALFKTIESQGAACDIIDYINPSFEKAYKPFKFSQITSIKSFLWSIARFPGENRKNKKFMRFVQRNTSLTKPLHTAEELRAIGNQYDSYITGSDQVWNLKCSGNETAYFLDFVSGKPKNSYAASFGDIDVSDELKEQYNKLLCDFSAISVRETVGIDIVKNITGKDCVQTLDPTLLLNDKQWAEIIRSVKPLVNEPYLLVYFMAQSDEIKREMLTLARRIANEKKYRVIVIGGSLHKKKDGINYVDAESPEDFLALFRDASFVVTNSFHGTAFSVNFGKDFYSYVKPDLTIKGRVESLLEKIGIGDRVFSYERQIKTIEPVDFQKALSALETERLNSIAFLRSVIYGE